MVCRYVLINIRVIFIQFDHFEELVVNIDRRLVPTMEIRSPEVLDSIQLRVRSVSSKMRKYFLSMISYQ